MYERALPAPHVSHHPDELSPRDAAVQIPQAELAGRVDTASAALSVAAALPIAAAAPVAIAVGFRGEIAEKVAATHEDGLMIGNYGFKLLQPYALIRVSASQTMFQSLNVLYVLELRI